MLPTPLKERLSHSIGPVLSTQALGGGCIHHAQRIDTHKGSYFFKWNQQNHLDNFEVEAKGLELLGKTKALQVPEVLAVVDVPPYAGLLMEFIDPGNRNIPFWEALGRGLAALHRHTQPTFGLDHNNYIGALPQSNTRHDRWGNFFIEERLLPQLNMPQARRYVTGELRKRFDRLFDALEGFFPDEPPALLHGDLWGGNLLASIEGLPVLIDPAVYYGHREAELAFMGLFDGHPDAFYSAYQEAYPVSSGWRERLDIYNLYPLLVHVNLFGQGYVASVERILKRF